MANGDSVLSATNYLALYFSWWSFRV